MRDQGEGKGVSGGLENRNQKASRAPMRLIFGLLFLVAAMICGHLFLKNRLSASDYVRAEAEGVDGFGSLNLSIDAEALISDLGRSRSLSEGDKEEIRRLARREAQSLKASKTEDLSNGDRVRVETDFGGRLKAYGSFRRGEALFQVEGLKARTELSLNNYVTVSFNGFDGHGEADVSLNREAFGEAVVSEIMSLSSEKEARDFEAKELEALLDSVRVSISAPEALKNGDTVYVSLQMEDPVLEESGIVFTFEDFSEKARKLTSVSRIRPADYLSCTFAGYDGSGRTELSFDADRLRKDLENTFRSAGGAYDVMGGSLAETASSDREGEKVRVVELIQPAGDLYAQEAQVAELEIENAVSRSFTTVVSQRDHLYNGNPVTVSVRAAEPLYLPHFGILLQSGSKTFETAKLLSYQYIYLNDFITPAFSGYEGYGTAEAVIDTEALEGRAAQVLSEIMPEAEAESYLQGTFREDYESAIDVKLSQSQALSQGDLVTLSVSMDQAEIPGTGIRFAFKDQEVRVEGLEKILTLQISDFLTVLSSGFEGAGETEVSLNLDALREMLERNGREGRYAEEIESAWKGQFSTSVSASALSNGDAVTVSSKCPEEVYLPEIGVRLVGGRRDFTIEGLALPVPLDLTEAVEVSFIGIAPNLYVSIKVDETLPFISDTSLSGMDGEWIHASYGDDYRLNITYDADALLKKGYVVSSASRVIRIAPLNALVIESLKIPDLSKAESVPDLGAESARAERERTDQRSGWDFLKLAVLVILFLLFGTHMRRGQKEERQGAPAYQVS